MKSVRIRVPSIDVVPNGLTNRQARGCSKKGVVRGEDASTVKFMQQELWNLSAAMERIISLPEIF